MLNANAQSEPRRISNNDESFICRLRVQVRRARFNGNTVPAQTCFLRAKAFLFLDMRDGVGKRVIASLWHYIRMCVGGVLAFEYRCSGKGLRACAIVRVYTIFMIIVFYCKLRWCACVCYPIFPVRVATFAFLVDVRSEEDLSRVHHSMLPMVRVFRGNRRRFSVWLRLRLWRR